MSKRSQLRAHESRTGCSICRSLAETRTHPVRRVRSRGRLGLARRRANRTQCLIAPCNHRGRRCSRGGSRSRSRCSDRRRGRRHRRGPSCVGDRLHTSSMAAFFDPVAAQLPQQRGVNAWRGRRPPALAVKGVLRIGLQQSLEGHAGCVNVRCMQGSLDCSRSAEGIACAGGPL